MPSKPLDLNSLLDKAKEKCGSDYATAKALGITPQMLSDWRTQRKNPQPEDAALIAAVAGLDPVTEMARAVVAKHEGTPKGERLLKAVGKALQATGEMLGSAGASVAVICLVVASLLMPAPARAKPALYDV
jgi:hypothetical protein